MGLAGLKSDDDEDEGGEVLETEVVNEGSETETIPAPAPDSTNTLVRPVEDIDQVVKLYEQFEQIKSKLLKKSDTTKIGSGIHVNKSGWRKIATAFNLSVEVVDKSIRTENGVVKAEVTARATAPNGKVSTEIAMCASNESNHMGKVSGMTDTEAKKRDDVLKVDGKLRRLKDPLEVNEHNIIATAATRAKNRAISDCVGGGEVSAEEIKAEDVLE